MTGSTAGTMILDARSIIFVTILSNLLGGAGLLAVARRGYLGEIPGASMWAWATLLRAVGWIIMGLLRNTLPDVVSVVIGNALIQLSLTLYLVVLYRFTGRPFRATWVFIVLGAEVALLGGLTIVRDLPAVRQLVLSAAAGSVTLAAADVAFRPPRRRLASETFVALLFAACGMVLLVRGVLALTWARDVAETPFGPNFFAAGTYIAFNVLAGMLSFGFLLMCSERYIEKRRDSEEALKRSALVDTLTQLPNRAMVNNELGSIFRAGAAGRNAATAVLFIDLDNFKYINDSLGHAAGDQLLIETAVRLTSVIRSGDALVGERRGMAGRFGGDEFVVVLTDLRSADDAATVAERVLAAMIEPFQLADQPVSVRCSIGISVNTGAYSRIDDLLRDADTAMFQAKAAGRATYVMFDEVMHHRVRRRTRLEHDLRKAIDARALEVRYLPIIDVTTGRVTAFEAFLRWHHPELGAIDPDEFLLIAEETGLIVPAGQRLIEEAVETLLHLKTRSAHDTLAMSVGISRRQLIDRHFRHTIESAMKRLPAKAALRLQLTEATLSARSSNVVGDIVAQLKMLGLEIHLEEFGAGLSSLSLLRSLPIDGVKIDSRVLDAANDDLDAVAVLNALITLGRNFGKTITVDGLSARQQLATVLALECEQVQGSLFGLPLSAAETENVLATDFSEYCAAA